jgi:PhnB protein
MEFYKTVFGGELQMQTMGEVPDEAMPPDMKKEEIKDMIMHARLTGGEVELMASDSPKASKSAAKIELSLSGPDEAKLRKIWDALAQGGKINTPLEKQFWGDTFGMVRDKYGIDWMVNITIEK